MRKRNRRVAGNVCSCYRLCITGRCVTVLLTWGQSLNLPNIVVRAAIVTTLAALLAGTVLAEPLPSQAGLESREFDGSSAKNAIVGRGYSLDIGLDSLFDSNVLREGNNFLRTTGSRSDFVFTPNATLQAGLPVGRQQLFTTLIIGRDFYARNTLYDRTRISAGGGANLRAGANCQGSVFGQYSERQGTQLDLIAVVPNKQQDTTYEVNAGCGRARGLGFGGGFTRTQTRNGAAIYSLFDSNTSTFSGNVRYNSGQLGTLMLTGEFSDVSYPGRGPPLFASADGVKVYTGQISYRREIGPLLTGDVGVSYIKAVPKLASFDANGTRLNPGYSGPGFNVSLNYHPGVRLSGTLSASRNVTASANVGALYVINANYGLDLTYRLSPRISTGVGGSYDTRGYRGAFASVADPLARSRDTLYRTYVQLSYTPVRRYSVNLTVAQQGLRSTPNIFDYNSTTAMLGLHVKF